MAASRRQKLLRWLKGSALVLLACYAALLLYVQVSERVMRHRAENLLAIMRELNVGRSTWADLQKIRTRWGAWGDYEGTCTQEQCDYTVSLSDFGSAVPIKMLAFFLGHGHLAGAYLRVTVEQGIVSHTSFQLSVQVPKGYGTRWEREQPQDPGYVGYSSVSYDLIARADSGLELRHSCCYWPNPIPHPNYVLTRPSGCEGCLAIWAEYLPQATPAEKSRLTTFNFDCITRWKPCSDEEDIMPKIGDEQHQMLKSRQAQIESLDQCAYSIAELSKAALNAAVVQVESMPKVSSKGQDLPRVRLVRRLAGKAEWQTKEAVNIDDFLQERPAQLLSESFTDRKPLIVLYARGPEANTLRPYTCGLIPDSKQNEKEVSEGVSLGKGFLEY